MTDTEKDSLDLVKFRKKYSTVISYEKETFVRYPSRTFLVKKGNSWSLIYWTLIKNEKKAKQYVDLYLYRDLIFHYKQKKKRISTAKGDSILAFFLDQQFSKLDTDSLNVQIGSNDSTFMSLSHCPTTSIYFYHRKKAVEKQAYCLFLYYNTAPNQHKIRFSACSNQLATLIDKTLKQ